MYNSFDNAAINRSAETIYGNRVEARRVSSLELPKFAENLSNEILSTLPATELARLLPFAENVDLIGGESIYQPDDAIRYVYFPETAVFSQFQILEDGRTCEITMTGKEGLVGLSALFNGGSSKCWTEISVGGRATRINSYLLEGEFAGVGFLQTKIVEYLKRYIEQISQRVICNCHHQVKERFATWLLMLENRCGSSKFSLTQEQIARFLGVHRPSLSCIAKELQRENVIAYSRGQITILDRRALKNIACSCYAED